MTTTVPPARTCSRSLHGSLRKNRTIRQNLTFIDGPHKARALPGWMFQVFKDSKHIVSHCVFAEVQLAGDIAVGQTVGK
jgi:hypothetical protein